MKTLSAPASAELWKSYEENGGIPSVASVLGPGTFAVTLSHGLLAAVTGLPGVLWFPWGRRRVKAGGSGVRV